MSKGRVRHTRKVRRQGKATLKHGSNAKRKHASKSGRTGTAFSKQLASRRPPE